MKIKTTQTVTLTDDEMETLYRATSILIKLRENMEYNRVLVNTENVIVTDENQLWEVAEVIDHIMATWRKNNEKSRTFIICDEEDTKKSA